MMRTSAALKHGSGNKVRDPVRLRLFVLTFSVVICADTIVDSDARNVGKYHTVESVRPLCCWFLHSCVYFIVLKNSISCVLLISQQLAASLEVVEINLPDTDCERICPKRTLLAQEASSENIELLSWNGQR